MTKIIKNIILIFIIAYLLFYFIPFSFVKTTSFYNNPSDKLWKHRFLDPVKDSLLIKEFVGFEVDVFFNKSTNNFDVKHHGKESNYTLTSYFQKFENINDKFFWIDFKNLNSENYKESSQKLSDICNQYKIKDRIFIESKNMMLLNSFQGLGFSVSYWVPNYHFIGSVISSFKVRNNIIKYNPNAISCDFHSLHFYTKKFPNYTIYCWANQMSNEEDKTRILTISKNENIKIILTDFDENFLSK